MKLLWQLAILLACLAGAAFAAGIETGLMALNRLRLQHQLRRNVRGAQTIRYFLTHTDILLSTTLIATNLFHVAAAVTAAAIGYDLGGPIGATVAGAALTLGILVACEYIPKAWFQASPSTRVLRFAPVLKGLALVLAPLVWAVNAILRLVSRQPASPSATSKLLVSREELLYLAKEGVQSGVLTPQETEMIHGVFALPHKTCGSLMVPREKMVVVDRSMTIPDFLAFARTHDISRYPVLDPVRKSYVGVVHVLDVLADDDSAGKTVADYLRPPQLVANHIPVDHLLPRMRVTRLPLFLVTNDRFEVVGLITLEDVLQEITGES
ncbi:MAG: DUF21 domain-containing protein [Kiritimatiellae bacterium]|nr:DUF21 domain-containing protein [Kiritimatiellia bacterium]